MMRFGGNSVNQAVFLSLFSFLFIPTFVLGQPVFTEVSEEAGINHSFTVFGGIFGGGAAVIDYNRDGWEDLFLPGGVELSQLLENQGDGSFMDVSNTAGLSVLAGIVTQGAAVADVNDDGWPDLFVTTAAVVSSGNFTKAPNVLLINDQSGGFTDQSETFGLTEATFSAGASFGDVNRDGYVDLYVCNYFEEFQGRLDLFAGPVHSGDTRPGQDLLYINDRGKRFVESSLAYGIERMGLTFQALWSDVDNDRDLDLLVANDFGNRSTPNLLYRNEFPENRFTEIGEEMGFNYGINGMGIDGCDLDGNGYMDYLITNIQASPFLANQGPDAPFRDETFVRRMGFNRIITNGGFGVSPVSWGVNFFDFDHDLDTDLFINNGCLNPNLLPNPNLLLENDGGRFNEYAAASNTYDHSIGRGSVVFDYDHDGDLDILAVNQMPYQDENVGVEFLGTRFYRNEQSNSNHWLKVSLQGNRSESNGIGSRVEVYAGGKRQVREVYGGSSHESQNSLVMHFGMGPYQMVDSILVKWSASGVQKLEKVMTNQLLTIKEMQTAPLADIKVFPSPFISEFWIDVPTELAGQKAEVKLYNLLGEMVFYQEIEEIQVFANSLHPSDPLLPGTYLLVLEGKDFRFVKKIVRA
jgi:hypothetical protein